MPVVWRFGARQLTWVDGAPCRLMGVINVTPDSFSDGGQYLQAERAIERALAMAEAGAELLDVGGESSRPGAAPISEQEELDRVIPVIEGLARRTEKLLSVDTTKARVAEEALNSGAHIVNDISGASADSSMLRVIAKYHAGYVLMHMRGIPADMQLRDLSSNDIVREVENWLVNKLELLESAGVSREQVCIDAGIGFGKTISQNLELIAATPRLSKIGRPVLVGPSRKSFLGALTGKSVSDRAWATAGACACAAFVGAELLRIHDVSEMRDAVIVASAIRGIQDRIA